MTLAERLALLASQLEAAGPAARESSERFASGSDDARSRLAFRVGCLEGALTDYASDLRALARQINNELTKENL